MNLLISLQKEFSTFIHNHFALPEELAKKCTFELNTDAKKQNFGDLTTNAAMILAKMVAKNPRQVAQEMMTGFQSPFIERMEIAGPGFINLWLTKAAFEQLANELFEQKESFFSLAAGEQKHRYDIEFVSANPTGPLHLGHGRGGIIGDVLANILKFLGHEVTKEYYINDAGNQIQKLADSFKARCLQAAGKDGQLPEDGYRGEYLAEMAKDAIKEYGNLIWQKPESFWGDYAKDHLLIKIKDTLERYGITFDLWFSEKSLHESGAIAKAIERLKENDYLYESEGALWFKSTAFDDDKDRVVRKADGQWTYIAADIAYLLDKAERGYDHLVMVLGHDHHSYAVRLQAMRLALGLTHLKLEIILYQLVSMKEGGQLLKLSKRAGNIITLSDVTEEVGADVARFFYLHRKADAQLDFDLDLALKRTEENPVYYVQYAYVRLNSILAKAAQESALSSITITDSKHLGTAEQLLIKKIISLKELLTNISENQQTHLLTYFATELADLFHAYYAINRVIDLENIPQSRARLLVITQLRDTFSLVLKLLGLSRPEKM
jgi:arginyl-tRNA synthetase